MKLADTSGEIAAGTFSMDVRQKRGKRRVRRSRGSTVAGGGPKERREREERAGPTLPDGA